MSATVIPIWQHPSAAARAKTFRAMAKSRHADAVRRLELGDRDTFFSMLRDVAALEDQAKEIERHLEQIEEARVATLVAVESILERAGRAS